MTLDQLQPGDMVYAASHIVNDGSIPALDGLATIATPRTRGVIINIGHLEEAPQRELFWCVSKRPICNWNHRPAAGRKN